MQTKLNKFPQNPVEYPNTAHFYYSSRIKVCIYYYVTDRHFQNKPYPIRAPLHLLFLLNELSESRCSLKKDSHSSSHLEPAGLSDLTGVHFVGLID
jgi:hypothetical protein